MGPIATQQYRGPNHVLISRRSSRTVLFARVRKLLASGRWDNVHIHGLGAALAPAVALAAALVAENDGRLEASCSTSTEVVIDPAADEQDAMELDGQSDNERPDATVRHSSAIHIALRWKPEQQKYNPARGKTKCGSTARSVARPMAQVTARRGAKKDRRDDEVGHANLS